MADNKWSKPANPPPPLFLGEKERNLVKQVNDELLERVIGQGITYLPLSIEHSNYHPLYGEAIEKSFLPPVRVYALVEFGDIGTVTEGYGLDKSHTITVRFHERRLFDDQNLYVREGDYVQYGSSFFEIVSLTEGRQLFGQVNHLFQIEATCIKTRKGLIDLSVLPEATVAEIEAAASEAIASPSEASSASPSATGSAIARIIYSKQTPIDISINTPLNTALGVTTPLLFSASAIFINGIRYGISETLGESDFYIDDGTIYNNIVIHDGDLVVLEILTLV
jgi:hypothetical protein